MTPSDGTYESPKRSDMQAEARHPHQQRVGAAAAGRVHRRDRVEHRGHLTAIVDARTVEGGAAQRVLEKREQPAVLLDRGRRRHEGMLLSRVDRVDRARCARLRAARTSRSCRGSSSRRACGPPLRTRDGRGRGAGPRPSAPSPSDRPDCSECNWAASSCPRCRAIGSRDGDPPADARRPDSRA